MSQPNNAKQSQVIVKQGLMVQVLHPPHKLDSHRLEVPYSGVTSLQNFI
jgi:hypothetical protein